MEWLSAGRQRPVFAGQADANVQSFAYWRQYKFPILVAIPGNIYGPYDNFDLEAAHVIPALVRKFVEAADDGKPYVEVWVPARRLATSVMPATWPRG